MKIIMGCDHGAFNEKEMLKKYLSGKGHDVVDMGTDSESRCNYPDYAMAVSRGVVKNKCLGILLCGSGIGVSMVANRFKGIRAALVRTVEEAELAKQHNNANILCLGGRISTEREIKAMVDAWLAAKFEEGRHVERLALFTDLGIE